MKKKLLVLTFIIGIFTSGVLVDKLLLSNNNIEDGFNDLSQVKHKNMLSMMLETGSGSGEYSLETRSSWPTQEEGYVFNSTLSKCENGSKLSWDDELNAVLMEGTTSDKCYVYFDVYVETDVSLASWVKLQYTGTQGENNLYYHDSTLENGAGDNSYRYAGSSDTTNNFVCFGSDEITCPDDNLYRIIGVFGDKVKLIKWDYATSTLLGTDGDYNSTCESGANGANNGLGCYSFTMTNSEKGSNSTSIIGAYFWNKDGTNTWSESNLNKINLNTNYVSNIGSKWSNKIAITDWIVGGNSSYDNVVKVNISTAYINEIVSPENDIKYQDEIGLMYATDYGFASSPSAWISTLYEYSDSSITDINWMYMGLMEWTITRSSNVILVINTGQLEDSGAWGGINNFGWAVRPVFYLNSDVTYVSGDGTKSLPIIIE